MEKQKVLWKIVFRGTDPLFNENCEIVGADIFTGSDIISTGSFKPEKALKKARLYCDINNYELMGVTYHSLNSKKVNYSIRLW